MSKGQSGKEVKKNINKFRKFLKANKLTKKYQKALKAEKKPLSYLYSKTRSSSKRFLMQSFTFEDTKQGVKFWLDVNSKWEKEYG